MQHRISHLARADIVEIIDRSREGHGEAGAERYLGLINAGIDMVADNPEHPLSAARPELGDGVRSWHLRGSRDRSSAGKVKAPRHVLYYRVWGDVLVIGRVLGDVMEPDLHLTPGMDWA